LLSLNLRLKQSRSSIWETVKVEVRGKNFSIQELEAAKQRQELYSKDAKVTYSIDGTIKYELNVNSWARGGVISVSRSCQQLPSLDNGWPVYVDGLQKGIAQRDESLIWGLGKAFNALNVTIGDRIQLTFDSRESPKIIVRKIND